jgi:formylglycine-generating enzyme required for sulfatase activity
MALSTRWSLLLVCSFLAGCLFKAPRTDAPLSPMPLKPVAQAGAQEPAGRDGAAMAYISPGSFLRGSADWEIEKAFSLCERHTPGNCNIEWFETESPQRKIRLSGYWMDIYEVTNARYDKCISDASCPPPNLTQCRYWDTELGAWIPMPPHETRSRFGEPKQPVVCVTWSDAARYCQWAGKRLPTEAEWEKAARGPKGRSFPWGEDDPSCDLANMDSEDGGGLGCGRAATFPVGRFPNAASPYGVLDMSGNVFEWVHDYDDGQFYIHSGKEDPVNNDPTVQTVERDGVVVTTPSDVRGIRGGAWNANPMLLRAANRGGFAESGRTVYTGFRCAMNP